MANIHPVKFGKRERMSFSRIKDVLDIPNLIEVQKNSYDKFIREGIAEVFKDFSPIQDYSGRFELYFTEHTLKDKAKYSEEECRVRDATYAAPLKVKVRLLRKDTGEIQESEVFMGDFPLMTDNGSFIINGAERVVVSQLVRSPGVYVKKHKDKFDSKEMFDTTVMPDRGAWLEFVTDTNGVLWVHVDRNRKLPSTVLMRAIGLGTDEEIRAMFGADDENLNKTIEKDTTKSEREGL
ncbi:MAG: DNA-directed RNA polymerase subunit beta, partial [Clostridia bacterium]|nr:DNA-directed RNA polymerase subunit beta [Clostridia bacterium]